MGLPCAVPAEPQVGFVWSCDQLLGLCLAHSTAVLAHAAWHARYLLHSIAELMHVHTARPVLLYLAFTMTHIHYLHACVACAHPSASLSLPLPPGAPAMTATWPSRTSPGAPGGQLMNRWLDCSTLLSSRQLRPVWWTQRQQQEVHHREQVAAACPLQQQLWVGLLVLLSQVLLVYPLGFMLEHVDWCCSSIAVDIQLVYHFGVEIAPCFASRIGRSPHRICKSVVTKHPSTESRATMQHITQPL